MKRTTEPRFANPDEQDFVQGLADGKCSTVSRRDGVGLKYFPTVDDKIIPDAKHPGGHATHRAALARGRQLRDMAGDTLAETNGSM